MIVWHFHIAFSVQYHYDFIVFIKLENWNNDLFSLFFFLNLYYQQIWTIKFSYLFRKINQINSRQLW